MILLESSALRKTYRAMYQLYDENSEILVSVPTYSYYCENCKTAKEEFHSMKTCPDFLTCEACGGSSKRQISLNEAVHYKGTCWSRDRYTAAGNLKWLKEGGSDD